MKRPSRWGLAWWVLRNPKKAEAQLRVAVTADFFCQEFFTLMPEHFPSVWFASLLSELEEAFGKRDWGDFPRPVDLTGFLDMDPAQLEEFKAWRAETKERWGRESGDAEAFDADGEIPF
jgi:hypothetical protein